MIKKRRKKESRNSMKTHKKIRQIIPNVSTIPTNIQHARQLKNKDPLTEINKKLSYMQFIGIIQKRH